MRYNRLSGLPRQIVALIALRRFGQSISFFPNEIAWHVRIPRSFSHELALHTRTFAQRPLGDRDSETVRSGAVKALQSVRASKNGSRPGRVHPKM